MPCHCDQFVLNGDEEGKKERERKKEERRLMSGAVSRVLREKQKEQCSTGHARRMNYMRKTSALF